MGETRDSFCASFFLILHIPKELDATCCEFKFFCCEKYTSKVRLSDQYLYLNGVSADGESRNVNIPPLF